MKHKYVITDSSKENHNSVDAKFKVQIPQGITGTTRVCVKSVSMPNSYHNIYGDLKTAKFVEFYRPTPESDWVCEVFSFNLAEGYTETHVPRRYRAGPGKTVPKIGFLLSKRFSPTRPLR